jgi:hypothetical protein
VIRSRRRACWVLSVWFSVWGATQEAKGDGGQDAGQPSEPPGPADPPAAEAENVSCHHQRYVVLATRNGFDPSLAAEVRKDLAAELGPRGYGVCQQRVVEGELAAEIWLSVAEPSLVSIQIDDLVTGKRVWRDVPQTKIPAGGKALAIAIAADELLRASWAELDLPRRDARAEAGLPAGTPAAAESDAASASRLEDAERRTINARASPQTIKPGRPRLPTRFLLALLPSYARSSSSWNAFGLDLRAQVVPGGRAWLEAGVGGFGALDADTALGSVGARGFSGALSAGACTPEQGRLLLCGGARGNVSWVQFRGDASPSGDAQGRKDALPALILAGVGQLGLRLSRRWLALVELSLGAAALGAQAKQGSSTLMALDGFVFSSALGVGFQP